MTTTTKTLWSKDMGEITELDAASRTAKGATVKEPPAKLLPCPFCGYSASIEYNSDNDWPRCVSCDDGDCEAMGPWAHRNHNHEEALLFVVAGWNRRITLHEETSE